MAQEFVLTAEDWFDNQLKPDWVSREAILSKAVAVSLLLHGFAFLVLMSVSLLPDPGTDTPPVARDEGILITLVRQTNNADNEAENMSVTPIPQEESQPVAAIPDPTPDVAETATTVVAPVSETQSDAGDEGSVTDRAATLALVNTAIADYRTVLQTDLNRAFVEGCIRRRNRYGPASDCPESFAEDNSGHRQEKSLVEELFAVVTRDADNARMRWQLERKNEVLQEIMASGGPAGEQAEIRWRLNRQYHAFLSDNVHPELTYLSQTAFVNNYNRTITAVPFQFRCSEFPKPCDYKFTGFTVKRPATYVEKSPSFAERTPLFMPSQD